MLLRLLFINLLIIAMSFGKEHVTIDTAMAEKAVAWLELVNAGAGDDALKEHFMKDVASTEGCKAIIDHWARFMDWDEERFYRFVMEALGRLPCEEPTHQEDGTLTGFGKRQLYWQQALKRPDVLRKDLEALKGADLIASSAKLARRSLPADAPLEVNFYVVLFGGSNAFAVNDQNGFDLLQMPKRDDTSIDVDQVRGIFAHEMHHVGFSKNADRHMKDVSDEDGIMLVAIVAAEGMPSYFIDDVEGNLRLFKNGSDPVRQEIAKVWEGYIGDKQKIFMDLEADIKANLEGVVEPGDLFGKWMGGIRGPAYFAGYHMFQVIDETLGQEAALPIAADYRQFLGIYNEAARKANAGGADHHIFDQELADAVAGYTGVCE